MRATFLDVVLVICMPEFNTTTHVVGKNAEFFFVL